MPYQIVTLEEMDAMLVRWRERTKDKVDRCSKCGQPRLCECDHAHMRRDEEEITRQEREGEVDTL